MVKDIEAIDVLFPELADLAPLLAVSTPKVTPAYPYQIIDQAKPTFFLTKLFGHLSFVSSTSPIFTSISIFRMMDTVSLISV